MISDQYDDDYISFARSIEAANLSDRRGRIVLDMGDGHKVSGVRAPLRRSVAYNRQDFQLLRQSQEYAFDVGGENPVEVSVQFYRSVSGWRLFAFVPKAPHLMFSVNVENDQALRKAGVITLSQKIVLAQRAPKGSDPLTKAAFKEYRDSLAVEYRKRVEGFGLPVTSPSANQRGLNRVPRMHLAVFRPGQRAFDRGLYGEHGELLNDHATPLTPETVLHDFLRVSLVKGHYSENKGYKLAWL